MDNTDIEYSRQAIKFLKSRDKKDRQLLMIAIEKIKEQEEHIPLKKFPYYKKRVGNYRIIYDSKQKILSIVVIDNRGQVYKHLDK